jgi:acyl-CoA thioesterase-1
VPERGNGEVRSARALTEHPRAVRQRFFKNATALTSAIRVRIVLWLAISQSADAARRDASGVRRILMLGDSLTDGYGLSRPQAYPALVAEKMRSAGYNNFEVINAGVSGDTTAGGLRRLPQYLKQLIDVVVLELGINDAFRSVPIDQMRTNLQMIIDRVRTANPKVAVVIAGMQLPVYGADSYVRSFGEMYGELAQKNHAPLLPYLLEGVGGDPSLNLLDRVHPNAAGHRILAEHVWRVLEPLLQKASAIPAARVD